MQLRKIICCSIYLLTFCHSLYSASLNEKTIEALSLLTFHTQEWISQSSAVNVEQDAIVLTPEERKNWWERAASLIYLNEGKTQEWREINFYRAYLAYQEAELNAANQLTPNAQESLAQACELLNLLRNELIDQEVAIETEATTYSNHYLKTPLEELDHNHAVPSSIKKKMSPYLIPATHPMRVVLDTLFKVSRITKNESTFQDAGFTTISLRPRSFVRVARHPQLPGYLIKAYLDNELRNKQEHESWEWLVKRCEGAEKVRQIINKRKIKHFVVAEKYIYPLPHHPSPPSSSKYKRHLAVLLVTDMNLAPDETNHHAWSHVITEEHLNELYDIVTYARGSSYRPDNISYTNDGKFAFIDTEYPSRGPDYSSIRHYLSSSMRRYWDKLVRNGR